MASDDGQKERQEGKGIVVMKEYSSLSLTIDNRSYADRYQTTTLVTT